MLPLTLLFLVLNFISLVNGLLYKPTLSNSSLTHLRDGNFPKLWFNYLEFSLQRSLRVDQYCVLSYLAKLYSKIHGMRSWCFPESGNSYSAARIHMEEFSPCGYVQFESTIKNYTTSWRIDVPTKMSLQVYFAIFEMDISHRQCENSAFIMVYYDHQTSEWEFPDEWIFCGHRKPWYETTTSNAISMLLRQLNVRQRCNMTFIYTSLEKEVAGMYVTEANIRTTPLARPNITHTLRVYVSSKVKQHRWRITTDYGFRLHFQDRRTCCSSNRMTIYDGYDEVFSKRYTATSDGDELEQELVSPIDVTSRYFQAEIHFFIYRLDGLLDGLLDALKSRVIFSFGYRRSTLPVQNLELGSVTPVANKGQVLYAAYSLGNTAANVYPNVSFMIRKFEGWNEGPCSFGGFIFTSAFSDLDNVNEHKMGPFCADSIPTEPLIGTYGIKHVVFGRDEMLIILYAFGPLYDIDIDLVVTASACEGIVEMPHSVWTHKDHSQAKTSISFGRNYQATCQRKIINKKTFLRFGIINIKRCIVLQSIGFAATQEEHYEIVSGMDVDVLVKREPPYLPDSGHRGSSRARLTIVGLTTHSYSEYLNMSRATTFANAAIIRLRIINNFQHHRITYSIRISTALQYHTCTNMTNVHREVGHLDGKHYFSADLLNKCGWLKHTPPAVYIFKIHQTNNTDTVQTKGKQKHYLIYIRITQSGCNTDKTAKTDKLSIVSKEGALVHSIRFKGIKIWEGDLHCSIFNLVVDKRSACTTLDMSYRSEMVVVQTDFLFIKFKGTEIFLLEVRKSQGNCAYRVWCMCEWGVCVNGVSV